MLMTATYSEFLINDSDYLSLASGFMFGYKATTFC